MMEEEDEQEYEFSGLGQAAGAQNGGPQRGKLNIS